MEGTYEVTVVQIDVSLKRAHRVEAISYVEQEELKTIVSMRSPTSRRVPRN